MDDVSLCPGTTTTVILSQLPERLLWKRQRLCGVATPMHVRRILHPRDWLFAKGMLWLG